MKAEPSRLIPRKPTENLELLIGSRQFDLNAICPTAIITTRVANEKVGFFAPQIGFPQKIFY